MNKREEKVAKNFAAVIRAGRKLKGLGQTTLSSDLGISQSLLCKIENEQIVPSAPLWFEMCEALEVPVHSGIQGFIDHQRAALMVVDKAKDCPFKISPRYSYQMASMSRTSQPFLHFFNQSFGQKKTIEFFKKNKTDIDFFTILDHPLNINFNFDIARELLNSGKISIKNLTPLAKAMAIPSFHGTLVNNYNEQTDAVSLLKALGENMVKYDGNWAYSFHFEKKNAVNIHCVPREHMNAFENEFEEMATFVHEYKKTLFKQILVDRKLSPIQVIGIQEPRKVNKECIYQIQLANH